MRLSSRCLQIFVHVRSGNDLSGQSQRLTNKDEKSSAARETVQNASDIQKTEGTKNLSITTSWVLYGLGNCATLRSHNGLVFVMMAGLEYRLCSFVTRIHVRRPKNSTCFSFPSKPIRQQPRLEQRRAWRLSITTPTKRLKFRRRGELYFRNSETSIRMSTNRRQGK